LRLQLLLTAALAMTAQAETDKIARGKYLVEEVARCQDCHTPKLPNGEFDKEKWMKGAVLNIQPIKPVANWYKAAPDITPSGRMWGRWKDEGILNYLKNGVGPQGKPAAPPMPTYRLSAEDIEAVFAYLKSLK
jgi:mono/diheme cytochrome c family protein